MSGLAAGYRPQQAGVDVVVVDKGVAPWGRAFSTRRDGFILDRGADMLVNAYAEYFKLAHDVGLGTALRPVTAPFATIKNGQIIAVDGVRSLVLNTKLLSWRARARLVAGMARLLPELRHVDTANQRLLADRDVESAERLSRRLFGREVTDYLIDPMIRLFNGAPGTQTSAVDVLGGLAIGAATGYALRGGVGRLPETLAAHLNVRGRTEATAVREIDDRIEVDVRTADGSPETLRTDGCVLATMLEPAAAIHLPTAEATARLRRDLSYIKVIKVQLAYSAATRSKAFLVQSPLVEDPELMGMFLDHNKCDDRAPAGHSLLTVYMDTAATTRWLDRPDDELIDWALGKVSTLLPELSTHLLFAEVGRWPTMAPSNVPGFYRLAAEAYDVLHARQARVVGASDWLAKTSQGAATSSGSQAAAELLERSPPPRTTRADEHRDGAE